MSLALARAHRGVAILALVLAAAGGAGCGTSDPVAHPASTAARPAPHPPALVVERDGSNGTMVHVRVGDRVELVLDNLYWTVRGSSAPAVLRQDGASTRRPAGPGHCLAGMGCGQLRTYFTARAAGRSVITAHRVSCGEAMRCIGAQGRFSLTVVVR
jgi:hypothetical protein